MTIGQRIAELRKKHNLSQEALGEALGVSRQSVSKWESDAALPEIDKLIALSKRFGVPVGVLLGVEEETARQAQAQPEREGPTEAEVLQQYLDSLPKRKPVSKKWRVIGAVALALFFFMMVNYIDTLESRINSLNSTVSNMSHQMANVQSELYGISDDISTQIDQALKQEYGLLASWSMELVGLDYQQGTAEVQLSAVLKNKVSSAEELSFYAGLMDGSYVTCHTARWDDVSGSYTAQMTLPMDQNELVYYLSTPEGIVCLADGDHDLCSLKAGTELQFWWADFFGSWGSSGINGEFELAFGAPWMWVKELAGELGDPEITAWVMYNDAPMKELELQNRGELGAMEWMLQGELKVNNANLEDGPKQGDLVWVEYTVTFESGPALSGKSDVSFRYTGTQWEEYQEDF